MVVWTPSRLVLAALMLAVCVAIAVPTQALAAKKIGLSSGTFKFELADGEGTGGTVFLTNDGDEEVNVMVYAADQQVDAKGNIDFSAPTRADITQLDRPSSWIGVKMPAESRSLGNVPYITLEPGERVPVEFTIEVPSGTAPGDHNVLLFFEMFDQTSGNTGAQTVISGRLGARMTMRVDGVVVERLTVRPFEVPLFVIGSQVPFQLLVNNEGNIDQRVTVTTTLRDRNGNDVGSSTAVDARIVFAQRGLETSGAVLAGDSPVGPLTLVAEVMPVSDDGAPLEGGRAAIFEERQVWMVPMWAVVALGILLTLVLARVVHVASRRGKRRKPDGNGDGDLGPRAKARAERAAARSRGEAVSDTVPDAPLKDESGEMAS